VNNATPGRSLPLANGRPAQLNPQNLGERFS
jgi:hypothetical protein